MPKIDVTQKLCDLDGNDIMGPPPKQGDPPAPMTVRSALIQALTSTEESQTGQQRYNSFRLAQRTHENDNPHFKAEDVKFIKDAVGKVFFPIVVGVVWDILDPPDVPPQEG